MSNEAIEFIKEFLEVTSKRSLTRLPGRKVNYSKSRYRDVMSITYEEEHLGGNVLGRSDVVFEMDQMGEGVLKITLAAPRHPRCYGVVEDLSLAIFDFKSAFLKSDGVVHHLTAMDKEELVLRRLTIILRPSHPLYKGG